MISGAEHSSPRSKNGRARRRATLAVTATLLAVALTGCAAEPSAAPPSPASTTTPDGDAPVARSEATAPRTAHIRVTGSVDDAFVKDVRVVGEDWDTAISTGEQPQHPQLPYASEVVLPAPGAGVAKLVVVAKPWRGASGDLSCEIEIDGEVLAAESSSGHGAATCTVVLER